jgi:transposase
MKREFLSQAESVFDKGKTTKKSESEQKEDQLKVENDFLSKALR